MSRRRIGHDASVLVLLVTACAMIAVAQLAEHLWPLALLGGAGFAGWHLLGRHRAVIARRASARRLDDARRERLAAELEQLAGRNLDEIVESYRRAQGQYKIPGRQP